MRFNKKSCLPRGGTIFLIDDNRNVFCYNRTRLITIGTRY